MVYHHFQPGTLLFSPHIATDTNLEIKFSPLKLKIKNIYWLRGQNNFGLRCKKNIYPNFLFYCNLIKKAERIFKPYLAKPMFFIWFSLRIFPKKIQSSKNGALGAIFQCFLPKILQPKINLRPNLAIDPIPDRIR